MAELIKCKECEKQISSALAICPHCGLETNPSICKGCNKPITHRRSEDYSKNYIELEHYFHPECYKIHLASKEIQQFSCPACKRIFNYSEITDINSTPCPNCGHPFAFTHCKLCNKLVEKESGVRDMHKALDYAFYYHPSCIDAKLRNNRNNEKGCFIATAIYNSSTAPNVIVLKEFRDNRLIQSFLGRAIVSFYYRISPPIASFLSKQIFLKKIVKYGILEPLVWLIKCRHK